ncbi:hypothetical protein L1887_28933 [Cichorium endivia]|nr:hypothetical protein L1887_28933 [Cichorium endivia]
MIRSNKSSRILLIDLDQWQRKSKEQHQIGVTDDKTICEFWFVKLQESNKQQEETKAAATATAVDTTVGEGRELVIGDGAGSKYFTSGYFQAF